MVLKIETKEDHDTTTTIVITVHNWKRLSSLKSPGDSFNAVIHRLLDEKGKSS